MTFGVKRGIQASSIEFFYLISGVTKVNQKDPEESEIKEKDRNFEEILQNANAG